ncbi:MAG TPA: DUF2306 domain-containing protein [Acidobacteriaceae bacterium]|jgi:hypothetical protein|nr:DUF2306 domain-containing protein [Acidobacteriaceae bacterium]
MSSKQIDKDLIAKAEGADSSSTREIPTPLWLRVGFWGCTVIAIAAVVRRIVALAFPSSSGPPQLVELDRIFASHSALTLAHIVPALAFVALTPFAIFRRFSRATWPERWLFPLGGIVGITAYAMSTYSVGGWTERSAVLFYNSIFLFSLSRAWLYKVRGQPALKRRWLIRAVVVLLGIATTRPVMGVFFATSRLTHLGPHQFFGVAFWIGFSINWIVVESWLRFKDRPARGGVARAG